MQRSEVPRVLVADDQRDVQEALRLLLKAEGFAVRTVGRPSTVIEAIRHEDFDVVLLDLNFARDTTSGEEGLDLLGQIRALDPNLPVVVITAWGTIELAVEAMRRGARDFIQKPWDNNRLIATVRNHAEYRRVLRRATQLEAENRLLRGEGSAEFIARSSTMRRVVELINRVGPTDAHVLITGESGTGKGLVARLIHSLSPRARGPFIHVNIGAIPETLFESELFGHVRGAFTDARSDRMGRFEMASGGTLFLDEIANIPQALQAKLLRVLENGEFEPIGSSRTIRVDVRIISATNADLDREIAAGRFRRDLYYRLNTVEIHLPPLRERREDIPLLAQHFLHRTARRYRKPVEGFEPAALQALTEYSWPGNIRELEHVVERAVILATGLKIGVEDLRLTRTETPHPDWELMTLEEAERRLIRQALQRHHGNIRQAARALGISRAALYRRMKKYRL